MLKFALMVTATAAALTACGDANLMEPFVSKDGDKDLLEEAQVQIDDKDYTAAIETLAKVKGDSNDKRLLQVAATLGASGLSVWQIVVGFFV